VCVCVCVCVVVANGSADVAAHIGYFMVDMLFCFVRHLECLCMVGLLCTNSTAKGSRKGGE
jgi:hypothetical protein